MKVIITKIWRGDQMIKGKPVNKIGIKTNTSIEGVGVTDKWLSFLFEKDDAGTSKYQEGMEVDIDVVVKGEYVNFSPAGFKKSSSNGAFASEVIARLEKLETAVFNTQTISQDTPDDTPDDNDF